MVAPLFEVPQEGSSVFSLFSLIKLHLASHPLASSYSHVAVSSVFCAQYIHISAQTRGAPLISSSMKWRHLDHFQLLSRAVSPIAVVAEMKIGPLDEMITHKVWKCLPLRNMGFLNLSCLFVLCVVCNVMELFDSRSIREGLCKLHKE